MQKIKTEKVLWYFTIFLGLMLCIRELREPDLWWQLRTGEWMLENHAITFKDVFSYTYSGVDWLNVKWGYEVIIAWLSRFFGPEGVMFLNMISVALILFFIQKAHFVLKENYSKKAWISIALASLLFLIMHSSRINGRPEMTTYTLTCIYLYLFHLYRLNGSKLIYAIIPLQIFWANMHEAYGVGIVLIILFLVAHIIENQFQKKKIIQSKSVHLMPVYIVSALSILGIMINPNGALLIDHYIEIYSQLQENKFTTENFSFKTKEYWNYIAYLNLIIFFITFWMIFINNAKKGIKAKFLSATEQRGLTFILIYFAFFYLSLQAIRNTFFFVAFATPLIAIFLEENIMARANFKTLMKISFGLFILFYLGIGTGVFYEAFSPREQYGLKVSSKRNALGAAKFIKENNIKGKGFVDYLNSSYLLWALKPDFKTYLDLRDLDIFPQKFMENVFISYENPGVELQGGTTLWEAMVESDSFDYVVMSNNDQFTTFNRHMVFNDPQYELVFADGVTSLYLSKNKYKTLTDSLGFKQGNRDIFINFKDIETKGFGKVATRIFWPFYKENEISHSEERLTREAYYRIIN